MFGFTGGRRRFADLNKQEVLAIAIAAEDDDAPIYYAFADPVRDEHPETARMLEEMAAEEGGHHGRLIALHQKRFGERIPLIRREHVAGFYARHPVWLTRNLGVNRIRDEVAAMERQARDYYIAVAQTAQDAETRALLSDLAAVEAGHMRIRDKLDALREEAEALGGDSERRRFVLTWAQPGLAGLMDGSVSTLAPIFATGVLIGGA